MTSIPDDHVQNLPLSPLPLSQQDTLCQEQQRPPTPQSPQPLRTFPAPSPSHFTFLHPIGYKLLRSAIDSKRFPDIELDTEANLCLHPTPFSKIFILSARLLNIVLASGMWRYEVLERAGCHSAMSLLMAVRVLVTAGGVYILQSLH